jgi:rare lipoprotein A
VYLGAGAVLLWAGACARADRQASGSKTDVPASPRVIPPGQPVPKGGGSYKVGNPYLIGGVRYTPAEDPGYDRVGIGSFYSEDFHGRRTANGEIFDMWALSAAHPTLPMPSYAYVTNLANGRTLLVRINDRGPYARGRVIDLSRAAARLLGYEMQGTAHVRVRYAGRAPLSGDDSHERRFLASQHWYRLAAWSTPAPATR